MPFPRFIAKVNRSVTNPILSRLAGRVGAFTLLEHVGRRSGKARTTPIMAFRESGGYIIALTYGPKTDWVANVLAAKQCAITIRRQHHELVNPVLIEADPASLDLQPVVTFFLKRIGVRNFLRLSDPGEFAPPE